MKKSKKKKLLITDKVLKYLKKKKIAVKKSTISRDCDLKTNSANRACRILRKRKLVGFTRSKTH